MDSSLVFSLTYIGPVNEAEKIEQRNRRDNVQVDLQPELPLGHRIILQKWLAISARGIG